MKKIIIGLFLLHINTLCFGKEVVTPNKSIPAPGKQKKSVSWADQQTPTDASAILSAFVEPTTINGMPTTSIILKPQAPKGESGLLNFDNLQDINLNESSTFIPDQTTKVKSQKEINDLYVDINKQENKPRKFLSYIFRPAKPQPKLEQKDLKINSKDIENIKDTNTLSLQEFNFLKNFIVQARQFAIKNNVLQEHKNTLGASYEASLPDTQAINNRIRNFDKATRNVSKSTLAKIKSLESQNELTFADKQAIVESLIQDQLNTIFGTDSITGEVKISCTANVKKQLTERILEQADLFDATKPDTTRLDAIAKASDKVMNEISQGPPVDATFTTTIDKDGTYTTSMKKNGENGESIETRSILNVEGDLIGRTLIVDNADGNGEVTFKTEIDSSTGKSNTVMIKPISENIKNLKYVANENETALETKYGKRFMTVELTSAESKMTNLQFALFQSMILGKLMLKISLWSTKQIAWNLTIHPINSAITLGCIVPLGLVVKTGANLAGYERSDPTILATFGTVVDFTMGNRRAILSNEAGRVFTKGSTISNALNFVNPLSTKEGYKADPNAEYFGAEAELGKAIVYGVKKLFPDRFGDRLISKENLKKSQAIDSQKQLQDAPTPTSKTAKPNLIESFNKVESTQGGKKKAQQLNKAQGKFASEIVDNVLLKSKIITKQKNVLGSSAANLLIDTNATIKRLEQLDSKTRDTALAILKMIENGQKNLMFEKSDALAKKTDALKESITQKTIQSQIDNVFGVNSLSGKSIYSLTPEAQQELSVKFAEKIDRLLDTNQSLPRHEKLQLIADMSDMIMNKMATDIDGSSGPIATFRTEFLSNGSYRTTISNQSGVSAITLIDRSNNITSKQFIVKEAKSTTTFDMIGKNVTLNKLYDLGNQPENTTLSINDATAVELVYDQFKAMTNVKTMIKGLFWTSKQVVMCAIPLPTTMVNSLLIAAISPIVIKGGSMMVGYKFSDPVVRTALMASIELTMGNKRGLLSADPNRVFSKGTIGSKIANSFTTGNISESFKEKRDPSEEYFHTIDDALIDSTIDAYNWLFSTKSSGAEKDFTANDSNDYVIA
jgi:hypothetical protein